MLTKTRCWRILYKNTPLQTNFNVNLTCLVPTENPEVGRPERLGLKEILWYFLHFRLDVVTQRLENELALLNKRIHILRGFVTIFDALDEIIRIIRNSDGKADAAEKIMKRFPVREGRGKERRTRCRTDRSDPGIEALSFGATGNQSGHGRTEEQRETGARDSKTAERRYRRHQRIRSLENCSRGN